MNYKVNIINNNAQSIIKEYEEKYTHLNEFIKEYDTEYKHLIFVMNLLIVICAVLSVLGFITIIMLVRNKIYVSDSTYLWTTVVQLFLILFCFLVYKLVHAHTYSLVWKIIKRDIEKYEFLIISLDYKVFVDEYTTHSNPSSFPVLADKVFYQDIISIQDLNAIKSFANGTIVGINMQLNECTFSVANSFIIDDITLPVEYKRSVDKNQQGIITVNLDKKEIIYYFRDEIPYGTFIAEGDFY